MARSQYFTFFCHLSSPILLGCRSTNQSRSSFSSYKNCFFYLMAVKSGLSSGSSAQHFVIIIMISWFGITPSTSIAGLARLLITSPIITCKCGLKHQSSISHISPMTDGVHKMMLTIFWASLYFTMTMTIFYFGT